MARFKTIIGRAEAIDFPARFLTDVPAKTDTGAYLSAIHATNIREVTKKNGKKVLKFNLLDDHPSYDYSREIEVRSYTITSIENSFGEKQERYKIELKVRLAGKVFRTPFTLADRSKKAFPVLMGRTLLNKRFLVDTELSHIDRKKLKDKVLEKLLIDDKSENEA